MEQNPLSCEPIVRAARVNYGRYRERSHRCPPYRCLRVGVGGCKWCVGGVVVGGSPGNLKNGYMSCVSRQNLMLL